MKNIAIIPARGGSKRIPRKNVKLFHGKPIIAWSIEAALESNCFDKVVVSTDDELIAVVAQKYGAEVPFLRPNELADDHTATRPVINHAINEIRKHYGLPDYVCTIYPTAPFIEVQDIRTGLQKLLDTEFDFALSVTSFNYPIQRALKLTATGGLSMFQPEHRYTRSQDLEYAVHDVGQFYWGRTDAFLENRDTFSNRSLPVVIPTWRAIDIDNEEDWIRAELIFQSLKAGRI